MTNEEREELIETIKQEILRLVAKRNCIIAGIEYNENSNYVDEFDICEALEHARAALAVAEPVIREDCAKIAEGELLHFPKLTKAGKGYNQACNEVAAAIREGEKNEKV